jgi:hypothetical protein
MRNVGTPTVSAGTRPPIALVPADRVGPLYHRAMQKDPVTNGGWVQPTRLDRQQRQVRGTAGSGPSADTAARANTQETS